MVDINNFFDNVEDVTSLEDNERALDFARQLIFENSDVSSDEDFFDEQDDISIGNSDTIGTEASDEIEIEIAQNKVSTLSPCVVLDVIDGNLQKCNSTENLRGLWQLVGIWQLDSESVIQAGKELNKLGVCQMHFLFDQNQLHSGGAKKNKDISQSLIYCRRCKFCGKNYHIFSRGKYCEEHSWKLIGKQIYTACIAQKGCNALQEFCPIVVKAKSDEKARYICC
jgi:hypothetical protein